MNARLGRFFACAVLVLVPSIFCGAAHADPVGTSSAPKYQTFTATASNGNNGLITGVASRRIRVWGLFMQSRDVPANLVSVQFFDAANSSCVSPTGVTNVSTVFTFPGRATAEVNFGSWPVFETVTTGGPLCFTANAAAPFSIQATYTTFDPTTTQDGTNHSTIDNASFPVTQSGTWNVGQSGTWNTNASQSGSWSFSCSSGCGSTGGSEGSPDVVKLASDQASTFEQIRGGVYKAGGFGVMCLGALTVMGMATRRRS